jgi:hypothetical protein
VWDQVRAQVGDQVGDQVWAQAYRCGYGLHDANWLSFYSFFLVVCRTGEVEKLAPLIRLAHHAGWWWPFEGACVLTDRPAELVMKGKKLSLVRYADGFGAGPDFNAKQVAPKPRRLCRE